MSAINSFVGIEELPHVWTATTQTSRVKTRTKKPF